MDDAGRSGARASRDRQRRSGPHRAALPRGKPPTEAGAGSPAEAGQHGPTGGGLRDRAPPVQGSSRAGLPAAGGGRRWQFASGRSWIRTVSAERRLARWSRASGARHQRLTGPGTWRPGPRCAADGYCLPRPLSCVEVSPQGPVATPAAGFVHWRSVLQAGKAATRSPSDHAALSECRGAIASAGSFR